MKLVKMAWILGGLAAFGLGVAAEGCSSSSGTATIGGSNCTALGACCATLTGTNATMCTSVFGQNVDSSCATFLTEIQASNLCLGTGSSGTGTGTGVGVSSGTGTGVGTGTGFGTGTGTGTTGSGTSAPPSDAGTGGADCEAPPTKVYAETKAGVYCPFSAVGDGGKNQVCAAGETCCEPAEGAGASTCVAAGTACAAMATSWGCEGTPDCSGTAGTICCGAGTIKTSPACGANPPYPYVSGFTASSCAATCPATGFQICSQTSECPSGQTCTPIKPKGNSIGYCAP